MAVLTLIRLVLAPILERTPAYRRFGGFRLAKFVNEVCDAFVYAAVFVFLIIRPFLLQTFTIPSGSMWPTLHVNDFILLNKAIYRYSDPKAGDIVVFRPPVEAVGPADLDSNGEPKVDFIKRCIGVPGDVIELREGVLYRNGSKVDEPYRTYSECTREAGNNCLDFRAYDEAERANMTMPNFKLVKSGDQVIPFNWTSADANSAFAQPTKFGDRMRPYVVAPKFVMTDLNEAARLKDAKPEPLPAGMYLFIGDNRNNSADGRAWGIVPRERIVGRSEVIWLPLNRWQMTR